MRQVLILLLVLGGAGGIALAVSIERPTAAFALQDDDENGDGENGDDDNGDDGNGDDGNGDDDNGDDDGNGEDDGDGAGNGNDDGVGAGNGNNQEVGAGETFLDIDPNLAAVVNPDIANTNGNQVHVVRIIDQAFIPAQVTIRTGDFVVFVNLDNNEHTASGSGIDTGTITTGQTAVVTFDTPGTISYSCAFHSEMTGEIIIEEGSAEAAATPTQATATATQAEATVAPTPTPESPDSTTTGEIIDVDIDNLTFTPLTATIAPGTTVRWTNNDELPHTITGDWGDSGNLDPGQTFEWTFGEAGAYSYSCDYHPHMNGEIVVGDG